MMRGVKKVMSEETPHDRLMTGKSWEDFCDALKGAGQTILADDSPSNSLDRAEGFRYLSRLTRAALETFVEYADPLAPELHRPVHETAKIGADNPDNHYQHASISGRYDYRIRGQRGPCRPKNAPCAENTDCCSGKCKRNGTCR